MENFKYKKSLGQNFIRDNNIINRIVDNALISKDTLVIEIGPGAGSLSKRIVPLSKYSILYEIDTRLKETLEDVLGEYDNYEIIFGDFLLQNIKKDVLKYDYEKIYVVANLPYYITTPIITKLMKEILPEKMILMVQDEVANRLSATYGSKDYGMISVLLLGRYKIKKLFKVNRNSFLPKPNVDSAVIMLEKNMEYYINDFNKYEKLIKDAFKFKRKNIKNNLGGYNIKDIDKILNKYNLSVLSRAEDVPYWVFIEIANSL